MDSALILNFLHLLLLQSAKIVAQKEETECLLNGNCSYYDHAKSRYYNNTDKVDEQIGMIMGIKLMVIDTNIYDKLRYKRTFFRKMKICNIQIKSTILLIA